MKTTSLHEFRLRNKQGGWTLVELLFVMLLIVALAGLIAAAAGPVKNRVARYRTENRMEALQTALADYRVDNGNYPYCEVLEDGGPLLYKTLFGDFNLNGQPDSAVTDLNDHKRKCYMPKLRPPKLDDTGTPTETALVMPFGEGWAVVDIWNEPFYYMNWRANQNQKIPDGGGEYSKGSYDLWSLGNDPDPGDDNRSMWIKNW